VSFTSALPTSPPQAGDGSLLETMLQEFGASERLAVTVAEANLLRDIQMHLPVNESDFLQSVLPPRVFSSRELLPRISTWMGIRTLTIHVDALGQFDELNSGLARPASA
jgi:hypothetical protein